MQLEPCVKVTSRRRESDRPPACRFDVVLMLLSSAPTLMPSRRAAGVEMEEKQMLKESFAILL